MHDGDDPPPLAGGGPAVLGRGLAVSPGCGEGELHVDVDEALDAIEAGRPVVLALESTAPADVPAMVEAAAVITVRGGVDSHTAVVTRSAGVPAVVSVDRLRLAPSGISLGDTAIPVGRWLVVDGTRGEVRRPARPTVVGLQLALASRMAMRPVPHAEIETQAGMVGDRYHGSTHRHLSVQSLEELAEAAAVFGRPIDPLGTRRNVTISDGRVPRTPGHRWLLGEVELEVVRDAAPCRMLDDELGDGARTAMRRRAGVICRVLRGGPLALGDPVDLGGHR